ncbi:MlaD family protein [Gaetbulibacter saemankumensis]|uniref:MlaD family protein n=1 Tax=Gaetbulibacter saemankumensis TaxID=311208 RepID=UPI00040C86E9|nr:MlaD family protein [Gaetbulibacter saemankumensis]
MKKTTNQKLRLGVFVVTGLLIFIVAIYFIGERQNLFNKTFSIGANFNNVNGLMEGNNVRYSGINVGTVKKITMYNDSTIHVSMLIDEKMVNHIKKDAVATIGTDGLVGNMIVNIIPGDGNKEGIVSGDVIKSYTKIAASEMLNTLNVTNENAALLTSKLLDITNAITEGKGTLGMLINDTIAANNVKQTFNNLRLTSIQANKSLNDINKIINSININESAAGVLLSDTIEAQKVRTIITNLEDSSRAIKEVVSNLNETLSNIKDGEGAINYLSNDKAFVESLEQTMKNIQEGTDKFNQNMDALKHSFLTRSYFKKLERQMKKSTKE